MNPHSSRLPRVFATVVALPTLMIGFCGPQLALAQSEPVSYTNFGNLRRITSDGATWGGSPLDGATSPWIWYSNAVHGPAPFWSVFDGTITYVEVSQDLSPPTVTPDGLAQLFERTATLTIEHRAEPQGPVVGTIELASVGDLPLTIDLNSGRAIVDEPTGMLLLSAWYGKDPTGVPEPIPFVVERETGTFAKDGYELVGEQMYTGAFFLALPLVDGLTPQEVIENTVGPNIPRRLIGGFGETVLSGQYSVIPEPQTMALLGLAALTLGFAAFVRSRGGN